MPDDAAVKAKTRATDLYKAEGKAELVHGEIVHMPPSGDEPGSASVEIVGILPMQNRPCPDGGWPSVLFSSNHGNW